MKTKKILIIGAGIAGLSMYHALKQNGITAEIIEKHSDWSEGGTGIGLPANSVASLEKLGFKDALIKQAHRIDKIEYACANGKTLSVASLTKAPLNQQPFLALSRGELIHILREGVDNVRFNTNIKNISQKDNVVHVLFSSGETSRYDLVIAADGIYSETRKSIFHNTHVESLGMTNWRFVVKQDTSNMHPIYYLGKDDAFALYPIGKNSLYCYGHIEDVQAEYLTKDPRKVLMDKFNHYADPVKTVLGDINGDTDIVVGRIESVVTKESYVNRVVLVGDALHACSPSLQQGAGQAVEDALMLSDLLASNSIDKALSNFQIKRMPQITWVVNESNRIMKMGMIGKSLFGRILRNFIVKIFGPANALGWRRLMAK